MLSKKIKALGITKTEGMALVIGTTKINLKIQEDPAIGTTNMKTKKNLLLKIKEEDSKIKIKEEGSRIKITGKDLKIKTKEKDPKRKAEIKMVGMEADPKTKAEEVSKTKRK